MLSVFILVGLLVAMIAIGMVSLVRRGTLTRLHSVLLLAALVSGLVLVGFGIWNSLHTALLGLVFVSLSLGVLVGKVLKKTIDRVRQLPRD